MNPAFELIMANSDFEVRFAAFLDTKRDSDSVVDAVVADIIKDVRQRGDAALFDYTNRFDRLALTKDTICVTEVEITAAASKITPSERTALQLAADRIHAYHTRQIPQDQRWTDDAGIELGWRWTPIDAVGIYVPGGLASYPSSVLMNAIPAKVAGAGRIAMAVPCPDGVLNPLVLAAAKLAGITEIYRMGGAQAVAALAYGTQSVAAVDKITGPGNAYVAAAKKQVFGQVGIDMIAGPSEILIIADKANNPDWLALDLLSQAEHDTAAQSILITDSADMAEAVKAAVAKRLKTLERREIAGKSWGSFGTVIVVDTLDQAATLSNRIAPEHLELCVVDPDALLKNIRHAGAIFLGAHTPEAFGDYVGGPNHVLPTGRSARFSSGLSVLDFMKRTTLARCSPAGLKTLGPAAATLAQSESLEAHGLSIRARLGDNDV